MDADSEVVRLRVEVVEPEGEVAISEHRNETRTICVRRTDIVEGEAGIDSGEDVPQAAAN